MGRMISDCANDDEDVILVCGDFVGLEWSSCWRVSLGGCECLMCSLCANYQSTGQLGGAKVQQLSKLTAHWESLILTSGGRKVRVAKIFETWSSNVAFAFRH